MQRTDWGWLNVSGARPRPSEDSASRMCVPCRRLGLRFMPRRDLLELDWCVSHKEALLSSGLSEFV
jgi:hypothetical protein